MTAKYLEKLPELSYRVVRRIGEWADAENLSVYLVGGTVRDLILGREHVDLDFVVEPDCPSLPLVRATGRGEAIVFAKKVAEHLGADQIRIHKDFQTAALMLKDGSIFDFAMCRSETYFAPGVLPSVCPGTIREDLFRRDFTVNAMALRINKSRWNELVDPFGGLKDLRAGRIRVLHDQSFMDDSTRILRAVRFEQRIGFCIEPKTLKLLKSRLALRASADGRGRAEDHVSVQRFFNEFRKMFEEKNILRCLERCRTLGVERVLHPRMKADLNLVKMVQGRFAYVRKTCGLNPADHWKMLMMAFLEPQTAEARAGLISRLSLSSVDRKSFTGLERTIDFLAELCQKAFSPSGVYQVLKPLTRDQCLYLCCRTSDTKVLRRIERFLKKDHQVVLAIDGNDIKALGITGVRIKYFLETALKRKIDVGLSSRKDEIAFVKHLIKTES